MMRLLCLKMFRDMKQSAATYVLCILVVAIGFCGYSVLELSYRNLDQSRNSFYEVTSFSDGFADVERAPRSVARTLERIPGIARAQGRLEETVRLSGYEEDIQLKLVSVEADGMNRPLLSAGVYPETSAREAVLGDGMAKARHVVPGDSLSFIINGKTVPVTVCGVGSTPENIYMIKDMGDMFPDTSAYDAAFMDIDLMGRLFGKTGLVNSFLIELEPSAEWSQVEEVVKEVLKPYGCYRVYDRKDHTSVSMLEEELKQLSRMSGVVPFLFLSVAAIILFITLSRLVEKQRSQIGTLLALGIPVRRIQLHYMAYGSITGILGGCLGGLAGYGFAGPLADFYRVYFRLPNATAPLSVRYFVFGTAVAALFCSGVAWIAAGNTGRLTPSLALRPAAPKEAKKFFLEKIPLVMGLFTITGKMALRSLTRNRKKAVLSMFGIAAAYMITASLVSMTSMFDIFIFDFWEKTQKQDLTVQFVGPVSSWDAMAAVRQEDITVAEGILQMAATLKGPSGKMDISLQAIPESSSLCKLYGEDGQRLSVSGDGVILSRLMSDVLGVNPGQEVEIEISYPEEKTERVMVTGIAAQYMGNTAYSSYHQAWSLGGYRNAYTGVLLKCTQQAEAVLKNRLEDAGMVSLVESRQARLQKYRDMMGSMSSVMTAMCMLGVVIGFVVVYISSVIRFEELKRELAILVSLGLTSRQCLEVISVSQYVLTFGGVLMGIPLTVWVSRIISKTMSSEIYTIPSFVDGSSLLIAMGLIFAAVWLSSLAIHRVLKKMSPLELLQDRE